MTLELFPDDAWRDARRRMTDAFERWIAERDRTGSHRRALKALRHDSVEVYRDMWGRFTDWCVRHEVEWGDADGPSLEAFVDSLGRHDDVTRLYARRMLRLIGRIDAHDASSTGRSRNRAVDALLARPRFRSVGDPGLPAHLSAPESRRLVEFLTVRGGDARALGWQDVRNRTAIALQLGAGITPGEARGLTLGQVVREPGIRGGEPWALTLPANGNFPARQAPLARWAGRQLEVWLRIRSEQRLPGDRVFPSTRSGSAWSKAASTAAFQDVLARAGIADPGGGTFKLRHTFALRQLTRHPADDVARWLGIRDPVAIERYRRVLDGPVDVV